MTFRNIAHEYFATLNRISAAIIQKALENSADDKPDGYAFNYNNLEQNRLQVETAWGSILQTQGTYQPFTTRENLNYYIELIKGKVESALDVIYDIRFDNRRELSEFLKDEIAHLKQLKYWINDLAIKVPISLEQIAMAFK